VAATLLVPSSAQAFADEARRLPEVACGSEQDNSDPGQAESSLVIGGAPLCLLNTNQEPFFPRHSRHPAFLSFREPHLASHDISLSYPDTLTPRRIREQGLRLPSSWRQRPRSLGARS
jgi:hypothetical protein